VDPAVRVGRDLLAAAEKSYCAVTAVVSTIQVDVADVTKLAHPAAVADSAFPNKPTHYWLGTTLNVHVIDVPNARLIAEGYCAVNTRKADRRIC
jgi:hypothetical protein